MQKSTKFTYRCPFVGTGKIRSLPSDVCPPPQRWCHHTTTFCWVRLLSVPYPNRNFPPVEMLLIYSNLVMTRSRDTSQVPPTAFPPILSLGASILVHFKLHKGEGEEPRAKQKEHYKFKNYLALKRFIKFHTYKLKRWHHSATFGLRTTGSSRSASNAERQNLGQVRRTARLEEISIPRPPPLELFINFDGCGWWIGWPEDLEVTSRAIFEDFESGECSSSLNWGSFEFQKASVGSY